MRVFYLLCFMILVGCHNEQRTSADVRKYISTKQQYLDSSFKYYAHIRAAALDSLHRYKRDSLSYVKGLFFDDEWTLDSIMVFNSDSTRFYSKLLSNQSLPRDKQIDAIVDFGGAMIGSQWYYFIMGTSTVVPRDHYHHDPYEPLTFEELSYLAWRRAIPGLIYRTEDGTIATRHESIDQMFFSIDQTYCTNPATVRRCRDSFHVATLNRSLISKLRKKEILEIQQDIQNSKKPYVPPYKELTWLDRLWGKEEKLFDSKAWKERYNYKREEGI